jgi:Putative Actinobacterial Holin-X, holin superfamily III
MPEYEQTILDVVKSAVRDAQDLVRGEIALAKSELRGELKRMAAGARALAAAAVMAVVALVFLFGTIAWAIADVAGWPVWAGLGLVTLLAVVIAAALAAVGRARLAAERHLPLTVDTMKENAKWIRARTS